MGFEANPIADCGSGTEFPTVEELVSKLQSSFLTIEFQYVAKTLTDREQHTKQKYATLLAIVEKEKSLLLSENLKLKTNVEEEKSLLVSENQRLKDELKKKQDEIDAVRKLNAEYERKFRVYARLSLEFDDNDAMSLEKIAKESMGSSINLKNKEQHDRATEVNRPPLFNEKEDSKKKTESKMKEIIEIDDDDDDDDDNDDRKCISTLKGKRVTKDVKREYNNTEDDDDDVEFISASKRRRVSKEVNRKHNTVVDDDDDDDEDGDSGSDPEIKKLYMSTIGKMKKQKERWESESDMVKDIEKDDDLCLSGVCALHRQRVIVHGTDIIKMSDLACKLVDDDPQRKLKKKASELNHLDLDNCRMLAKKYSLQLFNIYQQKSDPFFPNSRS